MGGRNRQNNRGGSNSYNNNKNRNNTNNNNNNNDGNGKKWCNVCKKSSHETKDCWKNSNNNHANTSKVNKNNNKNNNQQNQNGQNHNQNQTGGKKICTRCGWWNHEARICTAKELPPEQHCTCGCEFHQSGKCPWGNDPDVRMQFQDKATGKICQWCKDDGDGTHDYSNCTEVIKFRNTLKADILKTYDGLHWCWHCQSTSHKTRACDGPVATTGKSIWDTKINAIIQEWVDQDMSQIISAYLENEDAIMNIPGRGLRAPAAGDFRWCLYCQVFGHTANEDNCDMTEYHTRCPPRFKNSEFPKKPFVPSNSTSTSTSSFNNGRQNCSVSAFGADYLTAKCITPGCNKKLNFSLNPGKNDKTFCTTCHSWSPHPSSLSRRDSKIEFLKEVRKMLEATGNGIGSKRNGKNGRREIMDIYKFRPSIALPADLAVERWPEQQPRYDDLGTVPEESEDELPLFSRDECGQDMFNRPGNHQTYFPPVLIRLTKQDREIRDNNDYPINKSGRLGMTMVCLDCGQLGVVRDAEGDLVMCGTDAANTVGCGWGVVEWDKLTDRFKCRCLTILQMDSRPEWVFPHKEGR